MSITDWLERKSKEKSVSNITRCIPPLVDAVAKDLAAAAIFSSSNNMDSSKGLDQWKDRKNIVAEAQKELYEAITIWSNVPPQQVFTDVILPFLHPSEWKGMSQDLLGPVIVAIYRVCEAAALQDEIKLEEYVDPDIIQLVKDSGSLYK